MDWDRGRGPGCKREMGEEDHKEGQGEGWKGEPRSHCIWEETVCNGPEGMGVGDARGSHRVDVPREWISCEQWQRRQWEWKLKTSDGR